MINEYLIRQIKSHFAHQPTPEQETALHTLSHFLAARQAEAVFLLRGYAGTGKTSLVAALVKTLDALKQRVVLLAPTGRAAKVLSQYAGHEAYTIHKKIYRQRTFSNELDNYTLNDNLSKHTLFLVDEASMISNEGLAGSVFGTGRLLDDLVEFVYAGEGCKLLLIGDTAQLPPVGEELSPALFADALKGYGLEVFESDLTQVVRQEQASGILWNATRLRQLMEREEMERLPKIKLQGFADIQRVEGNELIDKLTSCYEQDGLDETMVICRSNKRANLYNKGIRAQVLWRDEELTAGDVLMVAKNNYHWTAQHKEIGFLANGERVVVRRIRRGRELYGFRFVEATICLPDQNDNEIDATLLLDALHADAPALSKADADRFFYAVLEDYADLPTRPERMRKMKADPHYNALQVKYAYAITGHKAQGGQWKNVFLDQGFQSEEYLTPDYFRWLYTAFTRATRTLYLVNYPIEQVE